MASTVVSFELALVVDLPLWWTSTVASFEASPEKTMLCTNLKNELSCLEPACFFEMRPTEAAGLAARRRLTAKDLTVEVILTIPEENAMDGSQATDATRAAAASVASTVEAAVAALLSGHHHQLASRLGMEVTPDVSSVTIAAHVIAILVLAPPPPPPSPFSPPSSPLPPSSPPSPSPSPPPPPLPLLPPAVGSMEAAQEDATRSLTTIQLATGLGLLAAAVFAGTLFSTLTPNP